MAAKRNSKSSKDVSFMAQSLVKMDLETTLIFLCLDSRVNVLRTTAIFSEAARQLPSVLK